MYCCLILNLKELMEIACLVLSCNSDHNLGPWCKNVLEVMFSLLVVIQGSNLFRVLRLCMSIFMSWPFKVRSIRFIKNYPVFQRCLNKSKYLKMPHLQIYRWYQIYT